METVDSGEVRDRSMNPKARMPYDAGQSNIRLA